MATHPKTMLLAKEPQPTSSIPINHSPKEIKIYYTWDTSLAQVEDAHILQR